MADKHESLTVSSSAIPFAAVPGDGDDGRRKPTRARIEARSGGGVYITWDNTTPTSTNGAQIKLGSVETLVGEQEIQNASMIRDGSTDAVLQIGYS